MILLTLLVLVREGYFQYFHQEICNIVYDDRFIIMVAATCMMTAFHDGTPEMYDNTPETNVWYSMQYAQ